MIRTTTRARNCAFLTSVLWFLLCTAMSGSATAQTVHIPDEHFKAALLADEYINTNGDDEIQVSEAKAAEGITVENKGIKDLTGLQAFENITYLDCSGNELTSLDLSGLYLDILDCSDNRIRTLDARGTLYEVDVRNNNLNYLNIKNGWNVEMYGFYATGNPLVCVQVDNEKIAAATWSDNVDPGVTFSNQCGQEGVEIVLFYDPHFKGLLLDDPAINTNGDHEIQVAEAESFTGTLDIADKDLDHVRGIESFTAMTGFIADNNNLTSLDLSASTELQTISVDNNKLKYLSIKNDNNAAVSSFNAYGNEDLRCVEVDDPSAWSGGVDGAYFSLDCGPVNVEIPDGLFADRLVDTGFNTGIDTNHDGWVQVHEAKSYTDTLHAGGGYYDYQFDLDMSLAGLEAFSQVIGLTAQAVGLDSLNISANPKIRYLNVEVNDLTILNVQNRASDDFQLYAAHNDHLTCIQVDDVTVAETRWIYETDSQASFSTNCNYNTEPVVDIPDVNFKAALIADTDINTNGDGEIQVGEAESFTGTVMVEGEDIADLTGIEAFTNVTILKVHSNRLSSVDLSANTALEELDVQDNQLTSLDVRSNPDLDRLKVQNNELTELDVSANLNLTYLDVTNNELTSLDVRNGNNENMRLFASGNADLVCIEVDDPAYAEANWDNIDPGASFSEDCSDFSQNITGTSMPLKGLEVSVYPNPSSAYLKVEGEKAPDEMRLYSVNGAEMEVRFVNGEADIRHLKQGVYVLKVQTGEQVFSLRLIKR